MYAWSYGTAQSKTNRLPAHLGTSYTDVVGLEELRVQMTTTIWTQLEHVEVVWGELLITA